MYGNHMFCRVECVSPRIRPKRENQKNEKTTLEKNIQKYVSKKEWTKYGKNIKKLSKKDVNVKKKP